jgi:hypothetical protein
MDLVSFGFGVLFNLLVLGLFAFLLVRGVTEVFVALFAAGALLHLVQTMGFFYMRSAPGGFSAHAELLPMLTGVGMLATLVMAGAFVALTAFLLRSRPNTAR